MLQPKELLKRLLQSRNQRCLSMQKRVTLFGAPKLNLSSHQATALVQVCILRSEFTDNEGTGYTKFITTPKMSAMSSLVLDLVELLRKSLATSIRTSGSRLMLFLLYKKLQNRNWCCGSKWGTSV